MNELVISEMKRVLELQKKKHIEEGPPSLELRKDRLDRSISMVKKYQNERCAIRVCSQACSGEGEATPRFQIAQRPQQRLFWKVGSLPYLGA